MTNIKRSGSPVCSEINVTHPTSHKFNLTHLVKIKCKNHNNLQVLILNKILSKATYLQIKAIETR